MKPEVVIVGGGVIGCSLALRLAQAGVTVAVLERGKLGGEASRAAAGMLSPQAESEKPDAFFHLAVKSRALYRGFVEGLKELSGIDAQYRDEGTLIVSIAGTEDHFDRWVSWQEEAGLRLERLTAEALRAREPEVTQLATGAIFLPDDHQVDNRLLMDALTVALARAGVEVVEGVEVTDILVEAGRARGVRCGEETRPADAVVIAAGCWSGQLFERLGLPAATSPVRGQMLAVRGQAIHHVLHSSRVYLVPRHGGRILIGATAEEAGFKKGVTANGMRTLLEAAVEMVPALGEAEILEIWSGLRPGTIDRLPILGESGYENLWLATGHFRNGILLAPATAALLSEAILNGRQAPELDAFSLRRFTTSSSR